MAQQRVEQTESTGPDHMIPQERTDYKQGVELRDALRLTLSTGEQVELVASMSISPFAATPPDSGTMRYRGRILKYVVTRARWGLDELSLEMGKTRLRLVYDLGFAHEKLPVPLAVQVADTWYRCFVDEKPIYPTAKNKVQQAIAKLPPDFLEAVRLLAGLALGGDIDGLNHGLLLVADLFDEPILPPLITNQAQLTRAEIETLTR